MKPLMMMKKILEISPLKNSRYKISTGFFCMLLCNRIYSRLWGSSYLVNYKGFSADDAARGISLFYGGITLGRFLSGFLTMKFNNRILIRSGQIICIIGSIFLLSPLPTYFSLIGLILVDLAVHQFTLVCFMKHQNVLANLPPNQLWAYKWHLHI